MRINKLCVAVFFICSLASLTISGCDNGGSHGNGSPVIVSETVGAAGGEIVVPAEVAEYGGLAISIPSGALTEDQEIRIVGVENEALPSTPPDYVNPVWLPITLEPDGLTFNEPLTISIPLSLIQEIQGVEETDLDDLHLYYVSSSGWTPVTSWIEGDSLMATLTHFSIYQPGREDWEGSMVVQSDSELPACDIQAQGRLYYIQDTGEFKYCDGAEYQAIDLTGPQGEPGTDGADGDDGAAGADGEDGQDGGAGGADSYPYVIYTDPFNTQAEGTAPDDYITIVFNKEMDAAAFIPGDTITLSADGQNVDGVLSFDTTNRILSFNPNGWLVPYDYDYYHITIAAAVTDTDGNAMGYDYDFGFGTSGFEGQTQISADSVGASYPQVASNPDGVAMAVWQQNNVEIYANHYVPGSGWEGAGIINDGSGEASRPQIVLNPDGYAMAVWRQYDGSHYRIYANHYVPGSGWQGAGIIDAGGSYTDEQPQIALNSDGSAVAVWSQYDGSHFSIYANHFATASGWQGAGIISDGSNDALSPQIALNSDGSAMAVWSQYDFTYYNLFANHYVPGSGWQGAGIIDAGSGHALSPQIALNSNGSAMAVWRQYDGSVDNIYANLYVPGSGWQGAGIIEAMGGDADQPQIALNPDGYAMAVWRQYDGRDSIFANHYVPGSGWQGAGIIEARGGDAYEPQITLNPDGYAIAVWTQGNFCYGNNFLPGSGWQNDVSITGPLYFYMGPQVSLNSNNHAMAVFEQGSDSTIYAITLED